MSGSDLSFTSVSFGYSDVRVLTDFTLKLSGGSSTAIVGPNGSGKSTVLGLIAGTLKPTQGTVDLGDADEVALAPQHSQVAENFPITVAEVVQMARWRKLGLLGRMTAEDRRIVEHWIAELDLGELRRRRIGELSGGQRQRTLVAQAFAQHAPIVALDEPTTGMDVASQDKVLSAIRATVDAGGTVVVATHDQKLARACDSRVQLERGSVISAGLP